jgi:hypothetical protein
MPTTYTIPNGSKQMYINLYTGTSGSQTLTNNSPSNPTGFQSGMQWFKSRSTATDHVVHDVLRGTNGIARLQPNLTNAESATGDGFVSINSNGFSLDSSGGGGDVNTSGRTYVAWQWAAPATGTTNTAGTITSSVSANPTSGFSVVTYTGNGSANQSIGHGLGVAPSFVIIKGRTSGTYNNWPTWHKDFGTNNLVYLNLTIGKTSEPGYTPILPTSSVYYLSTTTININNQNGINYVAYCWSEIAGYSAFGSYTGNGSTDGPFVYLGFRPRFIMFKRTDTAGASWHIFDSSINSYNAATQNLYPNGANAETANNTQDLLSNGFKCRSTDTDTNASGGTYIYATFAENPWKYANAR